MVIIHLLIILKLSTLQYLQIPYTSLNKLRSLELQRLLAGSRTVFSSISLSTSCLSPTSKWLLWLVKRRWLVAGRGRVDQRLVSGRVVGLERVELGLDEKSLKLWCFGEDDPGVRGNPPAVAGRGVLCENGVISPGSVFTRWGVEGRLFRRSVRWRVLVTCQ